MIHRRTRLFLPSIGIALTVAVTASVVAAVDPVEQVLAAVERAPTLDAAAQAIADAHLSKADALRLATALKQPRFAAKIKNLSDAAVASASAAAKRAAAARTAELNRQAAQRLASLNQKVSARVAALRAGGSSPANVQLHSLQLTQQMTVRMNRPLPEVRGRITSVSPNPVTVGASLTINGSDFGGSRGQVDLALLTSRLVVACSISSWSASRVVVTVPAGIETLISASGEDANLWLQAAGEETGPLVPIRVVPTSTPVIARVSSTTIEPGQLLIVDGSGFGTPAGQVRFRFPTLGQTQEAIVDLWAATGIVAHLREDLGGLPLEVRCEMQITTSSGRTVSRELVFHAASAFHSMSEVRYQYGSESSRHTYRSPVFREVHLANGWGVHDAWVWENGNPTSISAAGCECSLGSYPSGEEPEFTIDLTVQPNASCGCTAGLEITGPRGVPWGTEY